MRNWKRVIPFLILNIIISAATTFTVLVLWDRTIRPAQSLPPSAGGSGGIPAANGEVQPALTVEATLPPLDEPVILIETVIGAGDLQNEAVLLRRVGEGELLLTNWKISNGRGAEFVFPYLVLNKNGAVRLYTRAGNNTVMELFWGAEQAVFRSGDTVTLYDWQGNPRASYTLP
ncbi:MAG: lamin tail domain-containing protein [Chloroflexota bacterium]